MASRQDKINRWRVLHDEKSIIINTPQTARPLPDAGIHDEPARCLRVNEQWVPFVYGWLMWLQDVAMWPDATDEGYYAIRQMQQLLSEDECMDCEAILNCIENDDSVRDAIINIIGNTTKKHEVEITEETSNSGTDAIPVEPTPQGCDNDKTWGYVVALTGYIDAVTSDFYQNLAVISEVANRVEAWVDAVPVFGPIVNAVTDTFTEIGDNLNTSYNASQNVNLMEKINCDLFCIAVNNGCRLSIQDVIDYLLSQYNLSTATTPMEALQMSASLSRLALVIAQGGGAAYSGDDLVYISWLIQLGAVSIADRYDVITSVAKYYDQARQGNPDGDWAIACDDCVEWCKIWSFADGPNGWSISPKTYLWTELGETGMGGDINVWVERPINAYVTDIVVRIYGVGSGGQNIFRIYNDGVIVYSSTLTNGNRTITIDDNVGVLRVFGQRDFQFGFARVKVQGTGIPTSGGEIC